MHDGLNSDEGAERTIIDLPLEVKADGAPGSFEGYGAVFGNTDRDGDVVEKGAFGESLKVRMPALLWQHNAKEPIGRFDLVKEDKKGLFVKGRLSMSGKGKEAYDLLKLGALNGLSIGFVTKEALRNRATGTRTIKRAELMEVSLVTFPANELARVNTVKASGSMLSADGIETPRDFERLLREHGFSRSRAKAITAKGFRGLIEAASLGDMQLQQEILRDLEVKRSGLLSLLRSLGSRGSRGPLLPGASSVSEIVERVVGAYRSIRGTPMPIYVMPGRTQKFSLPLRFGFQSGSEVTVQTPESSNEFNCVIDFFAWTDRGPVPRNLKLSHRTPNGNLAVGGRQALESWINREVEKAGTEDKLDQFDRVLSRINDVFRQGLAPVGTITNKRIVSSRRVFISAERTGTTTEASPFLIRAR